MTTYTDLAGELGMQVHEMLAWADLPRPHSQADEIPGDDEALIRELATQAAGDTASASHWLAAAEDAAARYETARDERREAAVEAVRLGARKIDVAQAARVTRPTLDAWLGEA